MLSWVKKKLRPTYHRYFLNFHPVKALEWRVLKGWINPRNNGILLDVGSGNGQHVRKLQHSIGYIVGVDRNYKGIASAYSYNRPSNAAYIVGDAIALPFKDKKIDLALSICALEHFADDTAAIREVNRVLRKNGRFILTVDTLNYRGISPSYRDACRSKHFVYRFYTRESLLTKLVDLGFTFVRGKYIISSPVSSLAYKASTFFRWRRLDFVEPLLYLILFPFAHLIENIFGLSFTNEGYLFVAEVVKHRDVC